MRNYHGAFALFAVFVGIPAVVHAEGQDQSAVTPGTEIDSPPVIAASPQPPNTSQCCTIPAGTAVELVFAAAASSRTSKTGERVPIKLLEPITVNGIEVVPAGTMGSAEIIQASPARLMGKAGELSIGLPSLTFGEYRIALKRLQYGPSSGRGADRATMIATAAIGLPGLLLSGGNIDIAAGARANAVIAAEINIPAK